jgi:hypothetical protein
MNFTLSDIEDCNLTELRWCFDWLIETKKTEAEQIEKQMSKINK